MKSAIRAENQKQIAAQPQPQLIEESTRSTTLILCPTTLPANPMYMSIEPFQFRTTMYLQAHRTRMHLAMNTHNIKCGLTTMLGNRTRLTTTRRTQT